MLGNFVPKLHQTVSHITSPMTSPKSRRRFLSPPRQPARPIARAAPVARIVRTCKEELREPVAAPERQRPVPPASRPARHLLDKRKAKSRSTKNLHITDPVLVHRSVPPLASLPHHLQQPPGFAPLQGSKSLGRLDGLKEVQRLAQYEQLFQAILNERHGADRRASDESPRGRNKPKGVKQKQSDLERIQDLFPNDNLRLHDKDAVTMKMKGLVLKRGAATASRLSRALSAKALQRSDDGPQDPQPQNESPQSPGGQWGGPVNANQHQPATRHDRSDRDRERRVPRKFLMEAPVHFTTGVQSQDRHLFLFTDLLLVAKARSGGHFKLKDKVRVSELWLTRAGLEDVTEVDKSRETSFVMGWPTTNVVATFSTQAARDLWWNKLNEVLLIEAKKEPRSTNIQVIYYDVTTNIEYCKTFAVGPDETARQCIQLALEHLEMRGLDSQDFQLWVKTAREEAPYPLIGHERPFAIKLSCLRDGLSTEEGFDLDHCNNIHDPLARCQFILRNTRKSPGIVESKKANKKNRKSPIRIHKVFRRTLSRGEDSVDSGPSGGSGTLFAIPLSRLCGENGDRIPTPVMAMLQEVFLHGPFTQGIFRRSANARLVRELRERLDAGGDLGPSPLPVLVTAALLKDFLRSLPDPLLCAALYPQWMEALAARDPQDKLLQLRAVLIQLPRANHNLLSHFLCVLYHIARRAQLNLMPAANLGVCVGPSLLWSLDHSPALTRDVTALVELLVTHCRVLIGPHVVRLMGDAPERDPSRQDSGAEESDSLHSGGLRRDDSSIDSLERELMDPCAPSKPRKDKMSLSRDSGLTMSDSQLYTPDEEESGSTSSSGSGRAYDQHAKVTPSYSVPTRPQCAPPVSPTPGPQQSSPQVQTPTQGPREYVRVYGGWEERVQECCRGQDYYATSRTAQLPSATSTNTSAINPNFQRQDWFRQRSALRRLASAGPNTSSANTSSSSSRAAPQVPQDRGRRDLVRRSASEESLLSGDVYSDLIKRPALHGKGRAPAPPIPPARLGMRIGPNGRVMARSKSAHHLASIPCPYSRVPDPNSSLDTSVEDAYAYVTYARKPSSTDDSRIMYDKNEDSFESTYSVAKTSEESTVLNGKVSEESYDSSTLSDDDSTPHVSRSNSRSKDTAAATSAWESVYGNLGASPLVRAARVSVDTNPPPAPGPPLPPKLRHLPPVHVEVENASERRGRSRRRGPKTAQRSKSLPPAPASSLQSTPPSVPPPYRPPPCVISSRRAPITTYYLGGSSRPPMSQRFLDQEESYV